MTPVPVLFGIDGGSCSMRRKKFVSQGLLSKLLCLLCVHTAESYFLARKRLMYVPTTLEYSV
jgi:hypothetical protein